MPKKMTIDELGEMLTHVVNHMATKEDIAELRREMATKDELASLRTEMHDDRRIGRKGRIDVAGSRDHNGRQGAIERPRGPGRNAGRLD